MNTAQFLETTDSMLNMPKLMGMNSEKAKRWEKAVQFLRDEVLLTQAEKFKKDVMVLAKELIGEYATADDVIKIMSDKTTDNQKKYNVYLNTKRENTDAKSVAAMKEVKDARWQKRRIPVCQYSLDGKFIAEYPSMTEAAKAVGTTNGVISAATSGETRSAKGYLWKKRDDDRPVNSCIIKTCRYPRPVGQYNKTGKLVRQYKSIREAAGVASVSHATMRKALDQDRLLKGFMWKSIEVRQPNGILQ